MKITVEYTAQIKALAGTASEEVESPRSVSLAALFTELALRHGDAFSKLILSPGGAVPPSLIVVVNDEQVGDGSSLMLKDNDRVALITPMSGG